MFVWLLMMAAFAVVFAMAVLRFLVAPLFDALVPDKKQPALRATATATLKLATTEVGRLR